MLLLNMNHQQKQEAKNKIATILQTDKRILGVSKGIEKFNTFQKIHKEFGFIKYQVFMQILKTTQEVATKKSAKLETKKLGKPSLRKMKSSALQKIKDKQLDGESEIQLHGKEKEFELIIYNPKEETIDSSIFNPYLTKKPIDNIFSEELGVMPGTTYVVVGGPGVGKTTLANSILNDIQNNHPDTECMSFSSEMKRIDLEAEIQKKPWMLNVKHIILPEYAKEHYLILVETVILHGYDILVIDSFQNLVERLRTFCGMTGIEAANYLMQLFEKANEGKTQKKKHTSILLIQQVTKGGEFVGKNSLKHDTTGMLELHIDFETNERYCMFSKNRRCGVHQHRKLYYYMNDENKEIDYDLLRFNEDIEAERMLKKERKAVQEAKSNFDDIFLKKKQVTEDKTSNENTDIEQEEEITEEDYVSDNDREDEVIIDENIAEEDKFESETTDELDGFDEETKSELITLLNGDLNEDEDWEDEEFIDENFPVY